MDPVFLYLSHPMLLLRLAAMLHLLKRKRCIAALGMVGTLASLSAARLVLSTVMLEGGISLKGRT